MFSAYAWSATCHGIRTAWDLMVIPRSRSMSIRSRYCARITRSSTTPVSCSIRSARVDLPWSMWAMMQKLRSCSGAVALGAMVALAAGVTMGTGLTTSGVGGRDRSVPIVPCLLGATRAGCGARRACACSGAPLGGRPERQQHTHHHDHCHDHAHPEQHRVGQEGAQQPVHPGDRKSTRLNSSHVASYYAVFCLTKKIVRDAACGTAASVRSEA